MSVPIETELPTLENQVTRATFWPDRLELIGCVGRCHGDSVDTLMEVYRVREVGPEGSCPVMRPSTDRTMKG